MLRKYFIIPFKHYQGWRKNDVVILEKLDEFFIYFLIGDDMRQNVCTGFDCCSRCFKLRSMDNHSEAASMAFLNRSFNKREMIFRFLTGSDYIPYFYKISFLFCLTANKILRLFRRVHFDNRRISSCQRIWLVSGY